MLSSVAYCCEYVMFVCLDEALLSQWTDMSVGT